MFLPLQGCAYSPSTLEVGFCRFPSSVPWSLCVYVSQQIHWPEMSWDPRGKPQKQKQQHTAENGAGAHGTLWTETRKGAQFSALHVGSGPLQVPDVCSLSTTARHVCKETALDSSAGPPNSLPLVVLMKNTKRFCCHCKFSEVENIGML